ncbi:hypothetical protein FYK55_22730 [Roseiconus nitratireducens]|uniref:Uncharacterized protein n=1 Tax=Roseiconus nitratireducens TaxID=2605748 RepID=A0A5M6CXA9_9BACT|nr:hypothetical protein [Roseiconus nitratireducens]KAA5539868.1 hypothetical protein FYK55_22730 [Roseiconus nitratireducens]
MRHAVRVALRDRQLTRRGHVDAGGVCRVLLELAVDHFAERGKDELIAWGFGSSSEVGDLIYDLAQQGAVELAPGDAREDFDGWYDLRQPPETWKLQW